MCGCEWLVTTIRMPTLIFTPLTNNIWSVWGKLSKFMKCGVDIVDDCLGGKAMPNYIVLR